jgi:hypothetical protein
LRRGEIDSPFLSVFVLFVRCSVPCRKAQRIADRRYWKRFDRLLSEKKGEQQETSRKARKRLRCRAYLTRGPVSSPSYHPYSPLLSSCHRRRHQGRGNSRRTRCDPHHPDVQEGWGLRHPQVYFCQAREKRGEAGCRCVLSFSSFSSFSSIAVSPRSSHLQWGTRSLPPRSPADMLSVDGFECAGHPGEDATANRADLLTSALSFTSPQPALQPSHSPTGAVRGTGKGNVVSKS